VPEAWYTDDYLSRTIDGVTDLDWLAAQEHLGFAILIEGPTGCGKTSCVYAWAAREGLPVVNIPCSRSLDVESLTGRWAPTSDASYDFALGDLPLVLQHGGVILFDEVDRLDGEAWSYMHSLTDKRASISIHQAAGSSSPTLVTRDPDARVLIVGTYNGSYGHRKMDPATINRFQARLTMDYDGVIEKALVPESPTLLTLANVLRESKRVGDLRTETPTNALVEFTILFEALGINAALGNFCRRYEPEEQEVVRVLVEAHAKAISKELGGAIPAPVHLSEVEVLT